MFRRVFLTAVCLAALAGCNAKEETAGSGAADAASDRMVDGLQESHLRAAADAASAPAEPPGAAPRPGPPAIAVSVPLLAYAYDYGIEAPARAVAPLVARHEAACRAAGPTVCQITGSKVVQESRNRVEGRLEMRAQPAWLTRFREGLESQARQAGGRVTRSDTTTEDLSTQIVDTEAAIRARTTLRDRLQNLLATRPGKLSDLLELERELAQVQGEIDAAQSTLAMMRQRVATSAITIDYRSKGTLSEEGSWAPVAQAVRASQGAMATTIGGIILFAAVMLPIAAVGGLILWGVMRLRRLRRKKPPE